ncbi:aldose 1-epimerase family protein [Streptococcus iniae]|uniref:aldose 1-epimerase family protein n=1 Tax=Streptococcus iniae TaxID=1346 RepID=UPI0008DAD840|nr:aldose 1-epimerase family protein [Streptococcus iniae]OHX27330.1 protein lacX [Streptococcus iniae]RLV27307.1 aldose 1-epimerase family protein [Streptococcus iniae]
MAYQLRNAFLTVSFNDLGGELSSIKDNDGVEYLWQGNPEYWSGQAPLLFPICGSLREQTTTYSDNALGLKTATMPRHGIVRKEVFSGQKCSDKKVEFTLKSSDKMYQQYPYHFELTATYTLVEKKILVSYTVTNMEKSFNLPFTIGAHPAFNCPLFGNESYEDYYLAFEKEESCTSVKVFPETGLVDVNDRQEFLNQKKVLPLDYGLFKDDTILLDQLSSKKVSLCSKNHQKGLTLNLLDFPYLILWSTANKGPFIALEPWLGLSTSKDESDYFDEKDKMQFLKPQTSSTYSYEISIN